MTGTTQKPTPENQRIVYWREVVLFAGIATGLCALTVAVFRIANQGALSNEVAMFTPAVAAMFVLLTRRGASVRGALRTCAVRPVRPARTFGYCVLALILPIALGLLATLLAVVIGVADLDLENFSMLRRQLAQAAPEGVAGHGFPAITAVGSWLLNLLGTFAITLPLALGEEWGWRGYLMSRLLPLGMWRTCLLTGLIWGVWHAPLTVGVSLDLATIAVFMLALPVLAALVGWLRLASGSVWPAVVYHAANNALSLLAYYVLTDADTQMTVVYEGSTSGILGLITVGASVAVLVAGGQLRARSWDPPLSTRPSDQA